MKNITVHNTNHENVRLTYFDDRLIMIHSNEICAQWVANNIGIELKLSGEGFIKLGFMSTIDEGYQSFYFTLESYEAISKFFKELNYPMPDPINKDEIDKIFAQLEKDKP